MSFGSGGFGFGQSSQPASGFGSGGFGSTAGTTSGFGQPQNTTSAFGGGGTGASGGLFGGSSAGGFGSTPAATGGFGSTTTGGFGAKAPSFGTSTGGGGLFGGGGSSTTTAGPSAFGGFGAAQQTTNTSSPFGGGGGGLFGASKPGGFGSTPAAGTTGTSLFGGGATGGSSGFGTGTTGAFGATTNPGIGTNVGDPPGTQVVPFQATVEKEANSTTQQNSFQNVLFMDAYKKWSSEELRLADYSQGRRHGNATGTGAFGVNSGFGGTSAFGTNNQQSSGFGTGTTGTGLFGGASGTQQGATGGFGQTSTGGFGAPANNTGGGLFGQAKPAGGLFGGTATQQQPAQQAGGGMFGSGGFGNTAGNTGGGFGTAANNTATGGMFGAANANKPAGGFSFGGGANNTGAASGFGAPGNTSGFGAAAPNTNTGTGLFGGGNTGQQTGGGMFGQTQNNNAGGAFGGGGFGGQNQQGTNSLFGGAQQQKPAGSLFGSTNTAQQTGGGLFGGGATNTATSGFGAPPANQTGGGLFGAKPAANTGGGLFGSTNTAQAGTTGGGLFGGLGSNTQPQQQQQPGQGGLFGSMGQNQQKPSLFGTTNLGTGGGLFGGQNQPQQGSLFGSTQQQQPQALGGSAFGGSQSQSASQSMRTSLADMSAFGASSLFAGMGNNDVQNPGPLATPLSSAKKQPSRASILPIYKLSRPSTPKRGFGFSYSTYGTPTTPSSVSSTPGGFGQSLLAGSVNRGLSKSISTSNLRRSFNVEDSLLAPGAFSASVGPRNLGGPSSVKKLVINRDIRSDLFSTPTRKDGLGADGSRKVAKRVSFDTPSAAAIEQGGQDVLDGGESSSGANANPAGSARELGYLRPSSRSSNGVNGAAKTASPDVTAPEMEQVKGNELAIVHEEESPMATPRTGDSLRDSAGGAYWMRPSKEEIQDMNRVQRQKVTDFTVGREHIGHVRFRVPVDLSGIDLDEICGGLVELRPRSCTVYPNPAKKPAMGKGLNVPAEITLEQSYPRGKDKASSRLLQKHVDRLTRIPDTKFVSYNPDTGIWVFTVEHFTTYGLDEDEEDDDDGEGPTTASNTAAPASASPAHARRSYADAFPEADDDDTFNFKWTGPRRTLPGAFDSVDAIGEEDVPDHRALVRPPSPNGASDSASSGDHAADNLQDQADLEMTVEDDYIDLPEIGMARDDDLNRGSLQLPPNATTAVINEPTAAAGILRARMRAIKESAAPASIEVTGGDDWMDILKKSVSSGQQRDRAALRTLQEAAVNDVSSVGKNRAREQGPRGAKRVVSDGRGFATSIDLMNSLFGKDQTVPSPEKSATMASPAKSFIKWPYQKQHQSSNEDAMDDRDRKLHSSFKPRWGPGNTLLVSQAPEAKPVVGAEAAKMSPTGIAGMSNEVWSVSLASSHTVPAALSQTATGVGQGHTWITTRPVPGKVPEIVRPERLPSLRDMARDVTGTTESAVFERLVWTLAGILFDPIDALDEADERRRRRENLSTFWQTLVEPETRSLVDDQHNNENRAFVSLAGRRIADACKYLLDSRLYKLATLVPLIGTSDQVRNDMAEQVEEWYDGDVLSEVEVPIRAIYSLLAGNVSTCKPKTGAGSENRLEGVDLAKHFDLSWMQSFGLRLWYGIATTDDIAAAVNAFQADIDEMHVPIPTPYHFKGDEKDKENGYNPELQDMLWCLLKLYAGKASLEEVLQPQSCSSAHTDYSLCWQLGQILSASGKAFFASQSQANADALTVAYAAQLMDSMAWSEAVAVLLHLSDRGARAKAVQEALAQVAIEYADPRRTGANLAGAAATDGVKKLLELQSRHHIPKPWVAEACALAYRYLGAQADCTHPGNFHLAMKEVRCLALAERPQELHAVVVRRLDPLAVLQWPPARDADRLARYLSARPVDDGFGDLVVLLSSSGKQQGGVAAAAASFDFDRYAGLLRKRYEDAAEDDVVTLAALTLLMEFVQNKKSQVRGGAGGGFGHGSGVLVNPAH